MRVGFEPSRHIENTQLNDSVLLLMLSILYMLCIITPDYTQANFTARSILDQLYTLANSQTEQARYFAKTREAYGLIIAGCRSAEFVAPSHPDVPLDPLASIPHRYELE